MANTWFRLYNDIVHDPKIKLLAFEDRWHYVSLLCLKSSGELDKDYSEELRNRIIVAHFGLAQSEVDGLFVRLRNCALIDAQWNPVGWNNRQFISDAQDYKANKQKAYRDRQKKNAHNENCALPTVTAPDTETETDTDTELKGTNVPLCANAQASPNPNPKKSPSPENRQSLEDSFEKFWKVYPKRKDKKRAKESWMKLKPDNSLVEEIISAVTAASRSKDWVKGGGKFIPNPSTYLNGQRWEDEISPNVGKHTGFGNRDYSQGASDESVADKWGVA